MSRFLAGIILAAAVLPALAADTRDPNLYDTINISDPNGINITWDDANSPDTAGQVNISGATLFQSFFKVGASTIDAIDVDNDGIFGYQGLFSDQLAEGWTCGNLTTHWIVQYRGTGSGNGLAEFVEYQLLGNVPDSLSSDDSLINRTVYASGDHPVGGCPDEGQGTHTPFRQISVDIGVTDVPTTWFVTYAGTPDWNRKPGQAGYGLSDPNTIEANGSALKSLERTDPNGQTVSLSAGGAVGADTIVDTPIAWVPIVPIANHGVGVEAMTITDLRYGFLTGRRQNGENLLFGTRDAGSGTRNGFINSLGIDPSWGRGDNRDPKWADNESGYVGSSSKWTNSNSSSRLEDATENKRLLIAYTGLQDTSKAADHFDEGAVEIINVIFDNLGGTKPVRPSIQNVVENYGTGGGDPNNSFTLGGPETMAHRGTTQPGDPFVMANGAAAAYVRNIAGSIANFVANPGDPNDFGTPGQKLASNFILQDALDNVPLDDPNLGIDPENFVMNTSQVAALKTEILNNTTFYPGSGQTLAPYGSRFEAGIGYAPRRNPGIYTDGAYAANEYNDAWGGVVEDGAGLPSANEIQCDFDFSGSRDLNDLVGLIACIPDPNLVLDPNDPNSAAPYIAAQNAWALAQTGKLDNLGNTVGAGNPVVPAIIGDLNADGNLDAEDARLFADGLYVNGDCVDRAAAFTKVDTEFGGNFFGTVIASGAAYAAGDSRGDVAGGSPVAGSIPTGWDGVIDMTDVDYVKANYGDWSDIDRAILIDLSCDMNGDCVVDGADVADLYCIMGALGDLNCDGNVDAFDIDPFVSALLTPAEHAASYPTCDRMRADINKDGNVDAFDIDPFVDFVLGNSCK